MVLQKLWVLQNFGQISWFLQSRFLEVTNILQTRFFFSKLSHILLFLIHVTHSAFLCLSVPLVARLRKSQKYLFVIFLQVMSEHNLLEPEYLKLTFNTL